MGTSKAGKGKVILVELALTLLLVAVAAMGLQERVGGDEKEVSVVLPDSEDRQWASLKYGLKMAAEDLGVKLYVPSTQGRMSASEERAAIEEEIENGADAVIAYPVPGLGSAALGELSGRVPLMLVGGKAEGEPSADLPSTEPDQREMGRDLARGMIEDYKGDISGKTIGIYAQTADIASERERMKGFEEEIEGTGARILWRAIGPFGDGVGKDEAEAKPKADFVAALDDDSLTAAGESFSGNDLHGAYVYGIGNSAEAFTYLGQGAIERLVAPDEFSVGYQSLSEVARKIGRPFYRIKSPRVSHASISEEELFSKENEKFLFPISQ